MDAYSISFCLLSTLQIYFIECTSQPYKVSTGGMRKRDLQRNIRNSNRKQSIITKAIVYPNLRLYKKHYLTHKMNF